MAKSKKYYVVWNGHQPGVYDSWAVCQQQIKNYPSAKYKSFASKQAAEEAFLGNYNEYIGHNAKSSQSVKSVDRSNFPIVWESLSVDAACSGNPGIMEYRGVDTKTGIEIFRQGPFKSGTNNIGEFLALVHGLAHLKRSGSNLPIYTDSRTAMAWVRKKHPNTKLKKNSQNAVLFDLMSRAVAWLKSNTYSNEIIKWNTEEWGEIPADFGRK